MTELERTKSKENPAPENQSQKNYNFQDSEKKWQDFWQVKQIYKWDANATRADSFVVDTPPPTVSGQLHIGHVYSYTQTDFIVRFWRMMGKNIFYPMGFDDNGLPTERLVEKQRNVKASELDRHDFINICKEVVASEEAKFRQLFNQIALSVDWDLEYQTISPSSKTISQMSFLDLAQKGQVYRNDQPMLWDPVDRTALAQADIEDKEKQGVMNDVAFSTEDGAQIVIATTRPEMLPACVAVFYHPEDERYKHLKGKYAITPLFGVKVPILPDAMVKPDKGTGLVMCCTFGDQTDIIWWKTHSLPLRMILTKNGTLDLEGKDIYSDLGNELIPALHGLKINAARAKMIELLKERNLILNQTELTQTVKCAERSGAPLEILTTAQWFVRTIPHKEALLEKTQELNWHPVTMKIKLENWINSISWDWCISRQRYFGVPFPVWYSKRPGEEGKILFADIDQLPVDPLKDLPKGYLRDEVEPDFDVMDTWATSSVSPQLSSHGISANFSLDAKRHKSLFPVDLRPQAHEIIRTWAFYTMLKAHLHEGTLPWHNIMVSGWCLAEDRSKMSKSKGNIVNPEKLLEQYGSDVTRYWSATSRLGADTAYCENTMKNGKRLVNKLWNAAKFVSQHFSAISLEDKNKTLDDLVASGKICRNMDLWLVSEASVLVRKATKEMENYEYASAMHLIENFFWSNFCDNYLEITKVRSYNENNTDDTGKYSTILSLYHTMHILIKLMAPFVPHITEEIYQTFYCSDSSAVSVHSQNNWPKIAEINYDSKEACSLIGVLELIRKAKAKDNLSIKAPITLLEIKAEKFAQDLILDLKNVASIQEISFAENFSNNLNVIESEKLSINVIY